MMCLENARLRDKRQAAGVTSAVLALSLLLGLAIPAAAEEAILDIASHPSKARIYVQGQYRGTTPATLAIKSVGQIPQTYRITLVRQGYEKLTLEVRLSAGAHRSVQAYLKPAATKSEPGGERSGKATTAAGAKLAGKTVCIDPGHPSENGSGAKGKKISEVRANWLVALRLKTLLQGMGAKVVMTKSKEGEHVTNRRRAEIANAAHADLLIRLHCDAASGRGLAVFYPDRQGTRFGVTGPSKQVIARSRAAAKAFYPVAIRALSGKVPGRGIHGDSSTAIGSKQGALTGSIFCKVPVFTVEMVVLTSATDEAFMATEAGQSAMAKGLAAGAAAVLQ